MRSIITLALVLIVGAAAVVGILVIAQSVDSAAGLEWWYRFTAIVAVLGLAGALISATVKKS